MSRVVDLQAAHAQAQALALHAALYPAVPGSDECENCKHATGAALLIAAALMRCDAAPDPLLAIDHIIVTLQRTREQLAEALARRGAPS